MAKTAALRSTDIEGVYINEKGVRVDARGVAIAFKQLRQKENEQRAEILGHEVREPHELLKAVSMDPRYPLAVRLEQAYKWESLMAKKADAGSKTAEELAAAVHAALQLMDQSVGGEPSAPAKRTA